MLLTMPGCQQAPTDAIVSGGSMAPTFRGEHFQLQCDDCRYPFSIDANNVPKSSLAVCPNCGNPKISFYGQPLQSSTRMTVHQPVDSINRWDVIAFNEPASNNRNEQRLLTKRVVGLPGETVQLRDGNLLINGELIRKPYKLNQQVRIPIFDSRFKATSKSKRLIPANEVSGWNTETNGWSFESQQAVPANKTGFDWLEYQHIKGYRHSGDRYQVSPIEDDYGYNQNVARKLHHVNEVMLQLQIENEATAHLAVSLFRDQKQSCQKQSCHIEFQFDRLRILVSAGKEPPVEVEAEWLNTPSSLIEISNFDGQLQIIHNHEKRYLRTIAVGSNVNSKPNDVMPSSQISLGATNGNVRISSLQIFRDIHYYCETTNQTDEAVKFELGADEYFVLGDNAPISIDSRIFGPIRRTSIVGLVLPAKSNK